MTRAGTPQRTARARFSRSSSAVWRTTYAGRSRSTRQLSARGTRAHGVVAELLVERRDERDALGACRSRSRAPDARRSRGRAVGEDLGGHDVVEALDDDRGGKTVLQHLRGRRRAGIELGDVTVALPVVVVGVDDDLARELVDGQRVDRGERNGHTMAHSPAAAASRAVAARARGPSSAMRPSSVSGPRELAMTTSYPRSTRPARGPIQCFLRR